VKGLLLVQLLHEGGDGSGRGQLCEVEQTAGNSAEKLYPKKQAKNFTFYLFIF